MQKLFAFLFIFLTLTVGACSTNTQSQNTGAGAVTGGVLGGLAGGLAGGGAVGVGVGVVAGAIIGGLIGHNADSTDNAKLDTAMHNQTNQPMHWRNPKTGAVYTIAPTSAMMTINGNPNCRRFYSTVVYQGKRQKNSGIACLQSDNTWQVMRQ